MGERSNSKMVTTRTIGTGHGGCVYLQRPAAGEQRVAGLARMCAVWLATSHTPWFDVLSACLSSSKRCTHRDGPWDAHQCRKPSSLVCGRQLPERRAWCRGAARVEVVCGVCGVFGGLQRRLARARAKAGDGLQRDKQQLFASPCASTADGPGRCARHYTMAAAGGGLACGALRAAPAAEHVGRGLETEGIVQAR
jgi:hypothetical protein